VLSSLESFLLHLFADVKPKLDEERAVVRERALEGVDARDGLLEFPRFAGAAHVIENWLRVPRAEENADPTRSRQPQPITPELRALALILARCFVGFATQVARVEPFVQRVQRFALARAVRAVDEHDHREFCPFELGLRFQQRGPKIDDRRVVVPLAQRAAELR
jgi:hypothetical protein